jgi:hypothetical protein
MAKKRKPTKHFDDITHILASSSWRPNILISDGVPEGEAWFVSVDTYGNPYISGKIVNIGSEKKDAREIS